MIIKGRARGRARQLAAHLLHEEQNESIRVYECRGTLAQDVEGALVEMEARGLAARSRMPLYHASISPEADSPLSDRQIKQAVDLLELRLGLHGQPRVVVIHRKKDREHVHVVWSRIDTGSRTAIADSWNYRVHEKTARELESLFGHRALPGSRDRPHRMVRPTEDYELRQAERSGILASSVADELTALWRMSQDGADFQERLAMAGYRLARGDRRVYVVIDRAGHVHSLARRIHGADAHAIRKKLGDVALGELPGVHDARTAAKAGKNRETLRTRFALAARELANPLSPLDRRASPVLQAQGNLRAMLATRRRPAAAPIRLARDFDPLHPASLYRAARAALVAEYASRIGQVLCHAPRDELDAAIAALRAERDAALRALKSARLPGDRRQRFGGERRMLSKARDFRPGKKG